MNLESRLGKIVAAGLLALSTVGCNSVPRTQGELYLHCLAYPVTAPFNALFGKKDVKKVDEEAEKKKIAQEYKRLAEEAQFQYERKLEYECAQRDAAYKNEVKK